MQNDVRLIDANTLEKDIRELFYTADEPSMILTEAGQRIFNSAIEVALFEVVEAETVDAAPVVHGRWENAGFMAVKCSECKGIFYELGETNYCPNCGAKMDEPSP